MKTRTLFAICFFIGILLAGCGTGAPAKTAIPTNTTTADLTNISIKAEDLPEGLRLFSEDELKSNGLDLSSQFASFKIGAPLAKMYFYGKDLTTVNFLAIAFFYPMSQVTLGNWDAAFANPATFAKAFKDSQVLPNLSGIGNRSVGVSFIVPGYKANLLMIRRNNTMIVLFPMYEGETLNYDLKAFGQKMDQVVLAEYK